MNRLALAIMDQLKVDADRAVYAKLDMYSDGSNLLTLYRRVKTPADTGGVEQELEHYSIVAGDELSALRTDAARLRWLLHYLRLKTIPDEPDGWTCWLELDQIPYRLDPTKPRDALVLLDALREKFPQPRPDLPLTKEAP